MISEITEGVICISVNRDSNLRGKSWKDTPDDSSIEVEENLRARLSALSAEDINISHYHRAASSYKNKNC